MAQSFFSHAKDQPASTQRVGTKVLIEHSLGVKNNALRAFYPGVSFQGITTAQLEQWLVDICLLHDLGKYTSYFQNYLLNIAPIDKELKQHARLGAYVYFAKYLPADIFQAFLGFYVIEHHHRNLLLPQRLKEVVRQFANQQVFKEQIADLAPWLGQIEQELGIDALKTFLVFPEKKKINESVKLFTKKQPNIQHYYLLNYLFSLLIEADKLDASNTSVYIRKTLPANLVNQYQNIGAPQKLALPVADMTQNQLRNYVRAQVLAQLDQATVLEQHLFTLTAPTGIGKTLTSLHFALALKALLKEKEGHEAQIIYGLPFINIIEQAVEVYEEVFKDEAKVLAHYQYADVLGGFKGDEDDQKQYNQKLMALDTWQGDVVITSFVQFFHTLIGNRNKLLKKFHHYAGAIVILDEVQSLRLSHLPLIGAALYYLSRFLKTRVLLMTATQPKILDLANKHILQGMGEKALALELLPDYLQVFQAFDRTQIQPLMAPTVSTGADFVEQVFAPFWQAQQSALVVCNMVNRSIALYQALKDHLTDTPLYYLSTNIVPARRMTIIQQIKEDMAQGLKPVLVSTQSIEAGVDLDFDMGFRDLAPIDSLVQVAGRINRNNAPDKSGAFLYVFKFQETDKASDCSRIYDPVTEAQAEKALNALSDNGKRAIPEQSYLELVNAYFDANAPQRSFAPSRKFFESMKTLYYDAGNYQTPQKEGGQASENDFAVSQFKIIENNHFAVSVFVETDEAAKEAKDKFLALIHQKISREDFAPYKKIFHQRIISVPKYLKKVEEIQTMVANQHSRFKLTDHILCIPADSLDDYYDLHTGFIRQETDWQQKTSYSY